MIMKDDFESVLKIYVEERNSLLENIPIHHEYFRSILAHHVYKISKFTTFEELEDDMITHLKMSYTEWWETL